jgi:hypothetical protein
MALSLLDGAAWALMRDKTPNRPVKGVYVAVLRKGSASLKFIEAVANLKVSHTLDICYIWPDFLSLKSLQTLQCLQSNM